MKSIVTIFVSMVILSLASPLAAQPVERWVAGEIVDQAGFVTIFEKMATGEDVGFIQGEVNGQPVMMTFSQLRRLEKLGPGIFWAQTWTGETFRIDKAFLRATNFHGQSLGITCYKTGERGDVSFYYFDELKGRRQIFTICQAHIMVIAFGEHVGMVKYNPKTDRYYPSVLTRDPETGAPLVERPPADWNMPIK